MRKTEKCLLWVVYQMEIHGKPAGANAVCEQAEWDAMETERPGYHTLILAGISQSGFYINTFLAEGFNADPATGQSVFDGAIAVDGTGNWLALNQLAKAGELLRGRRHLDTERDRGFCPAGKEHAGQRRGEEYLRADALHGPPAFKTSRPA